MKRNLTVQLDDEVVAAAKVVAARRGTSVSGPAVDDGDAMVVTSAARVGASMLLSEDLQDGRAFGPVVVRNPFAAGGSEGSDD